MESTNVAAKYTNQIMLIRTNNADGLPEKQDLFRGMTSNSQKRTVFPSPIRRTPQKPSPQPRWSPSCSFHPHPFERVGMKGAGRALSSAILCSRLSHTIPVYYRRSPPLLPTILPDPRNRIRRHIPLPKRSTVVRCSRDDRLRQTRFWTGATITPPSPPHLLPPVESLQDLDQRLRPALSAPLRLQSHI